VSDTILDFVKKLKTRLAEKKSNYVVHHSMLGDTETGFYSEDDFSFEKLIKEIDEFSTEFQGKRPK